MALGAFDEEDLAPLAGLTNLSAISLKDRPGCGRSPASAGSCSSPTSGSSGRRRLSDVTELQGRDLIERLALQACRGLDTLDDLAGCTGLRRLDVAEGGDLVSAAPLGGLVELEELYAYGSTRFVDGDLSPLARLPRLTELRMQSRRHYRPSVPDLKAALAGRTGEPPG